MGPPTQLILDLKQRFNLKCFIETGTLFGRTALWAAEHFEQVITIEFSEAVYQETSQRYQHLKTIQFLFGDTRTQLRASLAQQTDPCLLWLDAHWSGGITYGSQDECPLLDELRIIAEHPHQHFILIDDARLFLSPPPPPHDSQQWPTLLELLEAIKAIDPTSFVVVYDDVLISVPAAARPLITDYCQQNFEQDVASPQDQPFSIESNGESRVIEQWINGSQVVFDVGANRGLWSKAVLNNHPGVHLHLFEPIPELYQDLLTTFAEPIRRKQLIPNGLAVASEVGLREFHTYDQVGSELSSLYRREQAESNYAMPAPRHQNVVAVTLDTYCQGRNIKRIHFLKIDVEGGEYEVLLGAKQLISTGSIDFIQFEYGGSYRDAGITLEHIFEYLLQSQYYLFKITARGLEPRLSFLPAYENYEYCNYLAVHERLQGHLLGRSAGMLDLQLLTEKYQIRPRGVIHIGAHEGKELATYYAMGMSRVVFIEANPAVFERLQAQITHDPHIKLINCAISNQKGQATLHVTSMDQSSSILPLKAHKQIYPDIQETHTISVAANTLDAVLQEYQLDPRHYNLLNIDIQGAELLALQGATNTLRYVEGINIEVNFEELYEGCALIDEIDDFLTKQGFKRVSTVSPYHPSWGDAFYIRTPVVAMSTLGANGRFGNQIFQYAFLRLYAQQHQLSYEVNPWVGQYLFGLDDPPLHQRYPMIFDPSHDESESLILHQAQKLQNVDLAGYFQYHTRYYRPYQSQFRSFFQPTATLKAALDTALESIRRRGKTLVGLHLRRGDFGQSYFFVSPTAWYLDWLTGFWQTLDHPVLYIASDEVDRVISDFAHYHPLTSQDLDISPEILAGAAYYLDFYVLSQCDVVALSNSSFSFAACMLNESGWAFYRPQLSTQKLIPFDPWNAEVLLRQDKVSDDEVITTRLSTTTTTLPLDQALAARDQLQSALQAILESETITSEISTFLADERGQLFVQLIQSGIADLNRTQALPQLHHDPHDLADPAQPRFMGAVLLCMLYCSAAELELPVSLVGLPEWFLPYYLDYLLAPTGFFRTVAEQERYFQHSQRWSSWLATQVSDPDQKSGPLSKGFIRSSAYQTFYSTDYDLKSLMSDRAVIIESAVAHEPEALDIGTAPLPSQQIRIKVGLLIDVLSPNLAGLTRLPLFKYLDPAQFEVILLVLHSTDQAFTHYCWSGASQLIMLPEALNHQIQVVRSLHLNMLLVTSNLTDTVDPLSLLATYRLAPIQIATFHSLVTTGFKSIDYFLIGSDNETTANTQDRYQETVIQLEGVSHCVDRHYESSHSSDKKTPEISRADLNFPETASIFVSQCRTFMLTPEVCQAWAEILVTDSKACLLILIDLDQNDQVYTHTYTLEIVNQYLKLQFADQAISSERWWVSATSRTVDLQQYLALADVYIAPFPYIPITQAMAVLEAQCPIVAMAGDALRSTQLSALLQQLGLEDWIATDSKHYARLAIQMTQDRASQVDRLTTAIQTSPQFLNPESYGRMLNSTLVTMFNAYYQEQLYQNLPLNQINLLLLPDWTQPPETLYEEIKALAEAIWHHPLRGEICLLINDADPALTVPVDPEALLYEVGMDLLLSQEVSDGLEDLPVSIHLLPCLSPLQWPLLIKQLNGRLTLLRETLPQLSQALIKKLPILKLEQVGVDIEDL